LSALPKKSGGKIFRYELDIKSIVDVLKAKGKAWFVGGGKLFESKNSLKILSAITMKQRL
jgi:hypothetical protein